MTRWILFILLFVLYICVLASRHTFSFVLTREELVVYSTVRLVSELIGDSTRCNVRHVACK